MRKYLLLFLFWLSVGALAAPLTITLQFDEPTTNTDLSVLDNMYSYQGYCSTVSGGPYVDAGFLLAPLPQPPLLSTLTMTFNNCMTTEYGDAYFVVTAVNLSGEPSVYSNELKKNFPDGRSPGAPLNLKE